MSLRILSMTVLNCVAEHNIIYDIFSEIAGAPPRTNGLQQEFLDDQVRQSDKFCSITKTVIQNHDSGEGSLSVIEIIQPSQLKQAMVRIRCLIAISDLLISQFLCSHVYKLFQSLTLELPETLF
jgi:hypothetical protein